LGRNSHAIAFLGFRFIHYQSELKLRQNYSSKKQPITPLGGEIIQRNGAFQVKLPQADELRCFLGYPHC
jgi:hypothetical protein